MDRIIKKINPKREWEIIKFEIHYNKPAISGPYPKDVVSRRELLLSAQCVLADYQSAKLRIYKKFFGKLYRTIMNAYFNW